MPATVFTCKSTSSIDRRDGGKSGPFLRGLWVLLAVAGGLASGQAQTVLPAGPVSRGPGVAVPTAAAPANVPANYALNPNDVVEVKVFQEDDMDWTVRVSKEGSINLPLVGALNVLRKTPDEVGEIVRTRLHDGYLVHPQVSVTVMEFSKRRFTILGEVTRAGEIDFPDNSDLTVLEAIGMAGGYTKSANASRVYVKRKVGEKEVVLTMDANRMARREAAPFKILPGDIITVGQAFF